MAWPPRALVATQNKDKGTAEVQMLARAGIQPDVYAVTARGLAGWLPRALVATQNKEA